jgi:acetyltransferase-like isoleucine patch superfamily enzyme
LPITHGLSVYWRRFLNSIKGIEDRRYRDNNIDLTAIIRKASLEKCISIAEKVRFSGDISVGSFSTIDRFTILHGGKIAIGRYTQIGANVGIYALNHPLDYLSIYNNNHLFDGSLKLLGETTSVNVGNDVWIGHGAIILPSVSIGNGAVIGAGAVVTKDIPDYAIAVGNPAYIIRKRFSDEAIAMLLQWQWWSLEPEQLVKYESLFRLNLNTAPELVAETIRHHLKYKNKG